VGKEVTLMTPSSTGPRSAHESRDGTGAGDHDAPYEFGRLPHALAPFPFSTRELARLMILRSRLQTEFRDECHEEHHD
jgi:hypothetical protein